VLRRCKKMVNQKVPRYESGDFDSFQEGAILSLEYVNVLSVTLITAVFFIHAASDNVTTTTTG